MQIALLLLLPILTLSFAVHPLEFNIGKAPNAAGYCRNFLPYSISSVLEADYLTWYGKVGDSTSGRTFEPGHLFERHVAVNNSCTLQQVQENKTVFLTKNEMVRTVMMDNVNCSFPDSVNFNYRQTRSIPAPTDYINGIDCKTGQKKKFNKYYIQFKKTLQNKSPTDAQYMASEKVTVWTVYPQR